MPVPAYTGERFRLSFGEQPALTAFETAVVATSWIGKLLKGGVSGLGPVNNHIQQYFSGDGRLSTERVLLGVDVGPVTVPFQVQDGRFLVMAFGSVTDEGTDDPTGGASTLTSASAAGATTISVADRTNFAVGDDFELGAGGPDSADPSEIRTVLTTGAGAGDITVARGFRRAHLNGATVNGVLAAGPTTHTLYVRTDFPIPFTLQGVHNPGVTDELAMAFAGCIIQETVLTLDVDGLLVASCTIPGSRPTDIVPPATLPTALTPTSFRFADAAYTYSSLPLVDGVRSHTTTIRNGGELPRHSRATLGEFPAEYVPDQAEFEHEVVTIVRRDDAWDAILARTDPVTGNVLFTSGARTVNIVMTAMVLLEAPHDNPEGRLERPLSFSPGEVRLVFVDAIVGGY